MLDHLDKRFYGRRIYSQPVYRVLLVHERGSTNPPSFGLTMRRGAVVAAVAAAVAATAVQGSAHAADTSPRARPQRPGRGPVTDVASPYE